MVDFREAEVDLTKTVENLTILCKIWTNMSEKMMIKARSSGKVVILSEEVLVLTGEEVFLIPEEDFVVTILDVAKRGIDPLSVDTLVKMKVVGRML